MEKIIFDYRNYDKIENSWIKLDSPIFYENSFKILRPWQKNCFENVKSSGYWIINAPTSAGKSLCIYSLIYDFLKNNINCCAIISVPQSIIGNSFSGDKFVLNKEKISFSPGIDLTQNTKETINKLKEFITRNHSINYINDRVLLCCHSTLINCFNENQSLFKNILIVIDESHHVCNHAYEFEDREIEVKNNLGKIVSYALDTRNINIGLTTATFFRGDRLRIIPERYIENFTRYNLSYDEYLKTCNIDYFKLDYALYPKTHEKSLIKLFNPLKKTAIYIPNIASKYSLGKDKDVKNILKAISNSNKPKIRKISVQIDGENISDVIFELYNGKKWIKVLNLVEEKKRAQKKKYIKLAHENSNPNMIDVIIALNMFKEGVNWRWAERAIVLGYRKSLQEIIQIFGRVLRDAPSKTKVDLINVIKFDFNNPKDSLNNYTKSIFLSMILEDIIKPIKFSLIKSDLKTSSNSSDSINPLSTISELENIFSESIERFLSIENKEISNKTQEKFLQIIKEVATEFKIKEDTEEVAKYILSLCIKRSAQIKGIDVSDIHIDILSNINPIGFLIYYTTNKQPTKSKTTLFDSIRQILIGKRKNTIKKLIKMAKNKNPKPDTASYEYRTLCELFREQSKEYFKIIFYNPDWKIKDLNYEEILIEHAKNKKLLLQLTSKEQKALWRIKKTKHELYKKLVDLAPQWDAKNNCEKIRQEIYRLLLTGKDPPTLYKNKKYYHIYKNMRRHGEFKNTAWEFNGSIKKGQITKKELDEIYKKGEPRPTKGKFASYYLRHFKNKKVYPNWDKDFVKFHTKKAKIQKHTIDYMSILTKRYNKRLSRPSQTSTNKIERQLATYLSNHRKEKGFKEKFSIWFRKKNFNNLQTLDKMYSKNLPKPIKKEFPKLYWFMLDNREEMKQRYPRWYI